MKLPPNPWRQPTKLLVSIGSIIGDSVSSANFYACGVLQGSSLATKGVNDILTSLVHLRRDIVHQTVKPYRLQYDPGEVLPRTNCANETRQDILIRDLRSCDQGFTFERNGFDVLNLDTQLQVDQFYNTLQVKNVFYPEVRALLYEYFNDAKRVEIMEHQVFFSGPQGILENY